MNNIKERELRGLDRGYPFNLTLPLMWAVFMIREWVLELHSEGGLNPLLKSVEALIPKLALPLESVYPLLLVVGNTLQSPDLLLGLLQTADESLVRLLRRVGRSVVDGRDGLQGVAIVFLFWLHRRAPRVFGGCRESRVWGVDSVTRRPDSELFTEYLHCHGRLGPTTFGPLREQVLGTVGQNLLSRLREHRHPEVTDVELGQFDVGDRWVVDLERYGGALLPSGVRQHRERYGEKNVIQGALAQFQPLRDAPENIAMPGETTEAVGGFLGGDLLSERNLTAAFSPFFCPRRGY